MQLWNTTEAKFALEKKVVGNAQIVIEVGAKNGEYTQRYLEIFPDARMYSFEPLLYLYQDLTNIAVRENRLTLSPLAVSDITGQVDFNIISHTGASSILPPDARWDEVFVEETIKVDTTTLDIFCKDINHIDLLTTDTNGFDLQVLKGAHKLLNARAIDVICTELIFWPYFEGQCNHDEVIKFLAGYGMHLIAIFPVYWEGSMRYADAIFVHEDDKNG